MHCTKITIPVKRNCRRHLLVLGKQSEPRDLGRRKLPLSYIKAIFPIFACISLPYATSAVVWSKQFGCHEPVLESYCNYVMDIREPPYALPKNGRLTSDHCEKIP